MWYSSANRDDEMICYELHEDERNKELVVFRSLVDDGDDSLCLKGDCGLMFCRLHDNEYGKDYHKRRYKNMYKVHYAGTKRPSNSQIAELKLRQAFIWMVHGMMGNGVDMFASCGARAIKHDIQPPYFVSATRNGLSEFTNGFYPFQTNVNIYLTCAHHAELVKRRWGDNTLIAMVDVTKRISGQLEDCEESSDTCLTHRMIWNLKFSVSKHELVMSMLMLAIEIHMLKKANLQVLQEATDEAFLSSSQRVRCFARLAKSLKNILDTLSTKYWSQSLFLPVATKRWLHAYFLNSQQFSKELQETARPLYTPQNSSKNINGKDQFVDTLNAHMIAFLSHDDNKFKHYFLAEFKYQAETNANETAEEQALTKSDKTMKKTRQEDGNVKHKLGTYAKTSNCYKKPANWIEYNFTFRGEQKREKAQAFMLTCIFSDEACMQELKRYKQTKNLNVSSIKVVEKLENAHCSILEDKDVLKRGRMSQTGLMIFGSEFGTGPGHRVG
ncbi:hypothetical protein AgCh_003728 [Apium graveolens]